MQPKENKKKHNRHQQNTDDGGLAMGEELHYVQMSRWGKHTGEGREQQQDKGYEAESKGIST